MFESDRPSGRTDWEPPRTRGLPRGSVPIREGAGGAEEGAGGAAPPSPSDPGLGWSPTSWRNGRKDR